MRPNVMPTEVARRTRLQSQLCESLSQLIFTLECSTNNTAD
jgi:hypothetical protein